MSDITKKKSNIRNIAGFMRGIWDWVHLNPAFGDTGIRVEDIDGHVERNGYHLFIEAKGVGVPVPLGQQIVHHSFRRDGDMVLIVWGDQNNPESVLVMHRNGRDYMGRCDWGTLNRIVKDWFIWADNQTPRHDRSWGIDLQSADSLRDYEWLSGMMPE